MLAHMLRGQAPQGRLAVHVYQMQLFLRWLTWEGHEFVDNARNDLHGRRSEAEKKGGSIPCVS